MENIFITKKPTSVYRQFCSYVAKGYPVQWGCLSDPFCNFEKHNGVGLEVMKILDRAHHPISFSTKGTWWVDDGRYMQLFKKNKDIWRVQFSFSTGDDEISKKLERGAPTPSERIAAMAKYYKDTGKSTTLRLRPFIMGITDKDNGHIDLIDKAAKEGHCFRVSTEFFCLETRFGPGLEDRYKRIGEMAGIDIVDFYRKNSMAKSATLKLNPLIKREFINDMEKACRRNHLYFYVSDAMLKDRSRNFSNEHTPDGKWNATMYDGQFSAAIQIAMKSSDGCVHWGDISSYVKECMSGFLWRHAMHYNTGCSETSVKYYNYTMADYIRWLWNTPNNHRSPYKYFHGILVPVGKDENNDVIYKYKGSAR
jgi:hypothetical protein